MRRIHAPSNSFKILFDRFEIGQFEDGRKDFRIIFQNENWWRPRWKDLNEAWKNALLVEKFNQSYEYGNSQRYLVKPIIAILADQGFSVRLEPESVHHKSKFLYEFDITAKIIEEKGNGIQFTGVQYVKAKNFVKARAKALEQFKDGLLARAKELFPDKLAKITNIRYRKYRLIESEDEFVDEKEHFF